MKNGDAIGVTGVATRIGVQGMGGIGKSVLAAATVRDDEVRAAYPGGIFWVGLGQTPDLLTRQSDLHWLMTQERGSFADAQQGWIALQQALRGRVCLIVLDDIWRLADVEAFNVLDTEARLLLTTRDAAIVKAIGAREHEVDRLERAASLRLLAQTACVLDAGLPAEADAIAEECGDLPLALALAGGMIGAQADMWRPVLDALRGADLEQLEGEFPGYPYPHVFAAIEASVGALGSERDRYLDLAIFPEDVSIPEATLAALWSGTGGGALQVRKRINLFRDRSLVRLGADKGIVLHDLQRDFVRKRADDQSDRHRRLVEAWRKQCRDGWVSGPKDGYFFRYLPLHLAQSLLLDELRELLLNPAWIIAKLAARDPTLLADYAQASDPEVSLVGRALMLSAHVIGRDPTQLPGQLTGRLHDVAGSGIAQLVERAGSSQSSAWFHPRTRSLTPPSALLRTFIGHMGSVNAVAVLPDGRRALVGSSDQTLRLWDLETGAELRRFVGHGSWVWSIALLRDRRRALSGSAGGILRLWDLETGSELRRFKGHRGGVNSILLLPDRRHALSGSWDRTLRLWDLETGSELRCLQGHEREVTSIALLGNGRRAVSSSADQTLRLWDLETGAELRRFAVHHERFGFIHFVQAIAVLADGQRALTGSSDGILRLWDLETDAELRRFVGHEYSVTSIALLADGQRALSGSRDRTLRLWDLETGAELRRFDGHEDGVRSVALLPDGRRAISGSSDRTLRLWDLENAPGLLRSQAHTEPVTSVAVLADGRRAISGSWDRTLRLWDLETGAELRRFEGHKDRVWCVALLADARRAISGSSDQTLRLWDLETGAELRRFEGHKDWVRSVGLLADGSRAISGSPDRTLRLWDLETGAELRRFEGHEFTSVAVLADGRRALSGSPDRTLRLWDLETGAELRRFEGHDDRVSSVGLLADGRRAISGCLDQMLRLWDLETGAELRRFPGHENGVLCVAPLPDGRRALSGSDDRMLRLWDLETGACLAVYTGDTAITCVGVAHDDLFVAGSVNGAIHILELIEPKPA